MLASPPRPRPPSRLSGEIVPWKLWTRQSRRHREIALLCGLFASSANGQAQAVFEPDERHVIGTQTAANFGKPRMSGPVDCQRDLEGAHRARGGGGPRGGVFLAVVRTPAQEPSRSDQTFRAGVDVIRLDVTVLDKKRQPVRGLTAKDFVGQGERTRPAHRRGDGGGRGRRPIRSRARGCVLRRRLTSNNLADRLGEGQAVAIILDDLTIPEESVEMTVSAREISRYIVNSLGPSDVAAIVYPFKPGRTEDFTRDRSKL